MDASAYQDADIVDTQITITLSTASTDSDYDGLAQDVTVTITDDDIPALVVDTRSLYVDENGSATFEVSLAIAPTDPVIVTVASDDATAATVTPTTLTFTSSDYSTPQTVTVTGVDDDTTSDEALTVSLTAASTDSDYDGLAAWVSVTVIDDDEPALIVSPTAVTVDENGTATTDLSLATQPSEPVTVSVVVR